MINYDIDQQQKDIQAQGIEELHLNGISDGCYGYPLQVKYMHDLTYLRGYVSGLAQWIKELERREQENYANSVCEF